MPNYLSQSHSYPPLLNMQCVKHDLEIDTLRNVPTPIYNAKSFQYEQL